MVASELREPVGASSQRIEVLTSADVDAGLALSDAAGWMQTQDDWALFIGAGRAFGLRDDRGRLVATAASLRYGDRAWISLVLVAAEARHRGLASALMARCIEAVAASGATPVLDATPAGAAVYRRLGFAPGFSFARWEGSSGIGARADGAPDEPGHAAAKRAQLHGADHVGLLDRVAALDRAALGLDRRFLLESFLARPATRLWLADDRRGFVIARASRRGWQIGPLVAADAPQAVGLMNASLDDLPPRAGGGVVIDIPTAHRVLADALASRGFAVQRPFVRMALGDDSASRLAAGSFALAGPEYG